MKLLYDNQKLLQQYYKCSKEGENQQNTRYSLIFYTDGGSTPSSQGIGGCCCISIQQNQIINSKLIGSKKTTNNRMELLAILQCLITAFQLRLQNNQFQKIIIHSDSTYSIDSFTSWIQKWILTKKIQKDVKNPDLMIQIYLLIASLNYLNVKTVFCKVKGHSGNYYNEMCDVGCSIIRGNGDEFMGYGTYSQYQQNKGKLQ